MSLCDTPSADTQRCAASSLRNVFVAVLQHSKSIQRHKLWFITLVVTDSFENKNELQYQHLYTQHKTIERIPLTDAFDLLLEPFVACAVRHGPLQKYVVCPEK